MMKMMGFASFDTTKVSAGWDQLEHRAHSCDVCTPQHESLLSEHLNCVWGLPFTAQSSGTDVFFKTCSVLTTLIPPVRVLSLSLIGSRRHTRFLTIFLLFQGKKVDGAANAYAINVSQKRKYRFVSQHAGRLACGNCTELPCFSDKN